METWAEAEILVRFPANRRKTRVVRFRNNHGFPGRFKLSSWGGVVFGGSRMKGLVLCCGGGANEKVVVVDVVFSVTSRSNRDVDYLGQSAKGDLNVNVEHLESPYSSRYSPRGIFCSRTLNLRSISAIGYDMDYTLMHYNVMSWEGRAYDYCMENLQNMGFPVDRLDDGSVVEEVGPHDYKGLYKENAGGLYSGGSAQMVENSLKIHRDEILYVGDHIYTDFSQSKVHLRWRTALICRELEDECTTALIRNREQRDLLVGLISQKGVVGDSFNQLRLPLQRRTAGRPAQKLAVTNMDDQDLTDGLKKLLLVMQRLDEKITPMLEADGDFFDNRYADIYTSRVSNFLHYTPFMYFHSQEQSLAHDSHCQENWPVEGASVED